MNNPNANDQPVSGNASAPVSGSATFVIKRELYPETFLGFNEYGLTSWTSRESDGWRVTGQEIEPTMKRIQATFYIGVEKLSAHLLPNAELSEPERENL